MAMTKTEMMDQLRSLVEGRIADDAWLAWWEAHGAELKPLLSPGEYLRLKPRTKSHGASIVIARCVKEAIAILKARGGDITMPDDVSHRREMDFKRHVEQIQFGGIVVGIAADEFSATCDHELTVSLYDDFLASGETDPEPWIRKRLESLFLCVGDRPQWVHEPDWPSFEHRPMVFVGQLDLKENAVTTTQLTWDARVFVFGRRVAAKKGYRVEYVVVTQSRD